jgi:nitrogen fixation protein FixH
MRTLDPSAQRPIRGWHVLALMLGFFAVIIVADGTMIYQAVTTFGGVDNPNAYREGVAYNRRIARDTQQAMAGWRDSMEVAGSPPSLRVALRDRTDAPLAGMRLVARAGRPATNRFDTTLAFDEVAPGDYVAALPAAADGTWIVNLSAFDARRSDEPLYQIRRRLWIKR